MTNSERFSDYERISRKIFSERELALYEKSPDKKLYVASRFAAKEAFLKALKRGILELDLKDIEVLKEDDGSIYIYFKGKRYACSLTHEGGLSIALAFYE